MDTLDARTPPAQRIPRPIGQRAVRTDTRLHVMGETQYIDDISLPNMLHARIKRAGIAAARIIRIDTRAAQRSPGVRAIVTGKDIPVNSFGPSLRTSRSSRTNASLTPATA
jgi:CO/xanthine dehydrogenase Mo-binding subunit